MLVRRADARSPGGRRPEPGSAPATDGERETMAQHAIEQFPLGPMDNFAYLVIDRASGEAAVIDPAWDAEAYRRRAKEANARIAQILLTHSHDDHVNALDAFLAEGLPVRVSDAEAGFWHSAPEGAIRMADGERSTLGETTIEWLVTPGHTPGSACLRVGDDLLAADTLFVYGCGRCDLPGSDPRAMFDSLGRLAREIAPDTTIYPGHDYGVAPTSTMGEQVAGNPFLMFDDAEAFVKYRMEDHGRLRSQPYGPERAPYPGD